MPTPPREKLTFSQAQGLERLPAPLQLGELPPPVRNALFAVFVRHLEHAPSEGYVSRTGRTVRSYLGTTVNQTEHRTRIAPGAWRDLLWLKHVHFDRKAPDEFDPDLRRAIVMFKTIYMESSYNDVLDLLEFLARQEHPIGGFLTRDLNATFEQYAVPYRLVAPGPSIVPIVSEEEGRAVVQAFADLGAHQFAGARKHLRDAGVYLGQPGKAADSVRESIHAVEAVCKVLAGTPGATLTAALNRLKNKVQMHGRFEDALEKLYSYTNDEKGIRHALLGDEANVDLADAQFMFGACASFVSYLIGKARTAGLA